MWTHAIRLETADLVLTQVEEEDLDAIVALRRSNPDRLARTEGTEAGLTPAQSKS